MRSGDTDNVRAYRRFLDAASKRREIEAAALCAEDVRLFTPLTEVWRVDLRGHDGIRTWISRMEDEWAFLEARQLGAEEHDGWILGRASMRGRGKASPSEIEFEIHHAVHFVDGLIDEFSAFLAREQALERIEKAGVRAG